jgi:polyhydroxyalkanoate synthesis repressor PhaR
VETGKVVIRKYANRRLYNTSASRYVNLEDIAAMIRNGTQVQVLDAKTGQDLTRVTLTQIILEDARDEPAGLPLDLLRNLIMTSDYVRREFMKSAFDAYSKLQDAVQSGFTSVRSAAMSPLEAVSDLVKGKAPESGDGPDVQELRRRVAELEARMHRPKRSAQRRKTKR